MRKFTFTIYPTIEQDELLHQLSKKTHVPMAFYLREAIDLVIEKYKEDIRKEVIKRNGERKRKTKSKASDLEPMHSRKMS